MSVRRPTAPRAVHADLVGFCSVKPTITLLTDFGTRDAYVAVLKGVILGIAPEATLVDVSHEVSPHDVQGAALLLAEVCRWYPPGTIHLAVVDPGVGSSRAIL